MSSDETSPKTRSRGGCDNCKRRKRKCDQTRPACLQCQRRKVACDGYQVRLQWDWGIASRGTFARATLPVPRPAAPALLESPPPAVTTPPAAAGWNFHNEESRSLFSQFLHSGVYTLYSTTTHSWITDMMADMAAESPAHLAACVVIQLLHQRDRTEDFHLCFESALRIFRSELSVGGGAIRRGTVCAGLLLCTLSIDQGIPWTNHIQCMASLYGLRDNDWPLHYFADPYICHLLEVMGVMDLPRLVLGRQTPALDIWIRMRRAQALYDGRIRGGVETVTGVPRTLLDILARRSDESMEHDLWQWEGEDGEFLQAHLWDAWRYAGILLVRRHSKSQASDDRCAPSSKHLLWRLVAALEAVRLGLQQEENKHLLVANGIFFPFIIASSESALLHQQPTWLAALRRIRQIDLKRGLAHNVRTACEILEQAWAASETEEDQVCDISQVTALRGIELALF